VVLHVFETPNLTTILVKLHPESQLIHTDSEVGIGNGPLPDVVNIAIGPPMFRMNRVEVSKICRVRFVARGMRDVFEVLVSAKVNQPRCSAELRILLVEN
jgi:hypothetical protein